MKKLSFKTFLYSLFIILSYTFFAATATADSASKKLLGTWNISAEVLADTHHKKWDGVITVSNSGGHLNAVLDWASTDGAWHVLQEMIVIKEGKKITLEGINVDVLSHPKGQSIYAPDSFSFEMKGNGRKRWSSIAHDATGNEMVFNIEHRR